MRRSHRASTLGALAGGLALGVLANSQVCAQQSAPPLQDSTALIANAGAEVVVLYRRGDVPPTARTVSELIAGRDAGVVVQSTSGALGAAARTRLRGPSSLLFSNEPLITLDGVPIGNSFGGIDVGGLQPQRLDDIEPDDVEEIQALLGAAASSLYGPASASGVIAIRTRRGQPGRPMITAYAQPLLLEDRGDYPANYASSCFNYQAAAGACSQAVTTSFSPLADRRTSPFARGHGLTWGATLSGGVPRATFYASAHGGRDEGILSWNHRDRLSLRVNADARPSPKVRLELDAGYTDNRLGLPYSNNSSYGAVAAGLLGSPVYVPPAAGGPSPNPGNFWLPQGVILWNQGARQANRRLVAGGTVAYAPLPWLEVHALLGADAQLRGDTLELGTQLLSTVSWRTSATDWWGEAGATATFRPARRVVLAAGLGAERRQLRFDQAKLHASMQDTTVTASGYTRVADEYSLGGPVLRLHGTFADRWVLDGVIRRQRGSSYPGVATTYPAAAIAWLVRDSSGGPGDGLLPRLRLHAAAGWAPPWVTRSESADIIEAFGSFRPMNVVGGAPAERSRELEIGADAVLLAGRASAGITAFEHASVHGRLLRMLPPVLGDQYRVDAFPADVRTRGAELRLTGRLLQRRLVTATISASAIALHSTVSTKQTSWVAFFDQRIQDGYSPGSYFAQPYTYVDRDGNGLLSFDEVTFVGDTAVYVGPSLPTFARTFQGEATLARRFTLSTLLEWRGGNKQYDEGDSHHCDFAGCAATADPHASLADQAAWLASQDGLMDRRGFVRDAGFVRWRELAVSARKLPLPGAGALRATLTLSVRNLATWTRYPGLDPEAVSELGSDFAQVDVFGQPQTRSFTARLTVSF